MVKFNEIQEPLPFIPENMAVPGLHRRTHKGLGISYFTANKMVFAKFPSNYKFAIHISTDFQNVITMSLGGCTAPHGQYGTHTNCTLFCNS